MVTPAEETRRSRPSGDFDLNLAPIIDCFTVLITYLLVSASFISVAALDTGLASLVPSGAPAEPVPALEIKVRTGGELAFRVFGNGVEGGEMKLDLPARVTGRWDDEGLDRRMMSLLRAFPDLREATITADSDVPYRELVRLIDALRNRVPKVYLGGETS